MAVEPRAEFVWKLVGFFVLWFIGSTLLGAMVGSQYGHAVVVFIAAGWVFGAIGFVMHFAILVARRGKNQETQ
jgi:hypothetical protein